jgi:hypothetical protein
MKTMGKIKCLIAASLLSITAFAASAQNATNIVNSVQAYFTSFNTNYSWTNISLEVDAGYAQIPSGFAASKLNAQYDVGSTKQYGIGGSIQFSGAGSAINGAEAQFSYALIQHFDTKLEVVLAGGFDDTIQNSEGNRVGSWVVEPGFDVKKKGTDNTYEILKFTFPVHGIGKFESTPTVYAGIGFTY